MDLPQQRHLSEVGGLREGEDVLEVVRPVALLYPWREYPLLLLGGFLFVGGVRFLFSFSSTGEPGEAGAAVVVALVFMGFGGLLAARVVLLMWRARSTVYVVTNHRLIELFRWFGVRRVRAVGWNDVKLRSTTRLLGQTGDVVLEIGGSSAWDRRRARGLLAVRDLRRIERLVCEQIEGARR